MSINFNIINAENGQQYVTVFANGRLTAPVDDSHPNFGAIVGACKASLSGQPVSEQEILDLFDVATAVARKFERLSERVTVENGVVKFDGDPVQPGLSSQIVRFMDEDADFQPLVNFIEKIEQNPVVHSKEQAWSWLNNHDFTLAQDGDVIAYKGVYSDGNGGLRSGHRGSAFVNDQPVVNDYIPNSVGDVVTMTRSAVVHDPAAACHAGLHVGTYGYAQSYAQGAMLKVKINPRDIVSVPTDAAGEKIRVCRYRVLETIDAPVTSALDSSGYDLDDDESYLPEFAVGDSVRDPDGDVGKVVNVEATSDGGNYVFTVEYEDLDNYRTQWYEYELV